MQDQYDYGHSGRPTTDTNPVGLAGFIVSLVSLVACGGLLSPVGLILSLFGCFRQPRGLAIAGVVLGLVGSGAFILGIVLLGAGLIIGAIALIFGASFLGQTLETSFDANEVRKAIVAYERAEGSLPTAMSDLSTLDEHAAHDLWDTPYRLEIDSADRQFTLISLGKDKTLGTDDDIRITLPIASMDGDDGGDAEQEGAGDTAMPEGDPASTVEGEGASAAEG